jgi:hypothetical protein
MTSSLHCPYCGLPAELVTGAVVYPHRVDLAGLRFWLCKPCGAYVGCHRKGARVASGGLASRSDGTVPLGALADAVLRAARNHAHADFDPLWQSGELRRLQAYAWMAETLCIPVQDAHIGMFDLERCQALLLAIERRRNALRAAAGERVHSRSGGMARRGSTQRLLQDAGLQFEVKNQGIHFVVFANGHRFDYWPGTRLWIHGNTGDRGSGIGRLIGACRKL